MNLQDIRDKLNNLPVGVAVAVFGLILAVAIWVGVARSGSRPDYKIGDLRMKCTKCGHTEMWSLNEYDDRVKEELPGDAVIVHGPRFTCPKCGAKYAMIRVPDEEESTKEAEGGETAAEGSQ